MELGETGFEAGNIAAQGAHFGGVLELAAGLLEAQLEKFLAQVAALGLEFGLG
jgi:cephalosporin-C deacetylase-like acetyl esterase